MTAGDAFRVIAEHACVDVVQGFYERASVVCYRAPMRFSVCRPPQAAGGRVPVLYLAGLTCTEESFMVKAGAQRVVAELRLMLVVPATNPRVRLRGDDAKGAKGFSWVSRERECRRSTKR